MIEDDEISQWNNPFELKTSKVEERRLARHYYPSNKIVRVSSHFEKLYPREYPVIDGELYMPVGRIKSGKNSYIHSFRKASVLDLKRKIEQRNNALHLERIKKYSDVYYKGGRTCAFTPPSNVEQSDFSFSRYNVKEITPNDLEQMELKQRDQKAWKLIVEKTVEKPIKKSVEKSEKKDKAPATRKKAERKISCYASGEPRVKNITYRNKSGKYALYTTIKDGGKHGGVFRTLEEAKEALPSFLEKLTPLKREHIEGASAANDSSS